MTNIRVRFAPSPTGFLHIGGARTALFNWLFAKRMNGTFILRIEDTDELRSTDESTQAIFRAMRWLGMDWNEGPLADGTEKGPHGPYFQSKRAEMGIYKKYADQIMAQGLAYHCYCTPEELEAQRKQAQLEKRPPKYDGRCRHLTDEQKKAFEAQGRKPVVRFRMPDEGTTSWNDLIRGEVKFENKLLYDFIMVKASGYPTYNFACVIDDHLMEMSHVIRGDDHISNTPLQVLIYKTLGWKLPEIAHLSMILGPDGTKLSKRNGNTSVDEYQAAGYLPQAVLNYLALLGWATSDSQQIFTPQELVEKFDIAGCQKNPGMFDPVKFKWMNGEYIRKMTPEQLYEQASPFIKNAGVTGDERLLRRVVALEQEKYKLLGDIPGLVDFFFKDEIVFDEKSVEKVLKKPGAKKIVSDLRERCLKLQEFTDAAIEKEARAYAAENGMKAGQVFHPLRVSASGRTEGPTLFKMLEYLGREKVAKNMERALTLCD
jgi:glutamyl-tRNA synthetase